jgi:alkanesulfonate monooxygenase SsuD/methylene tetrahydromethanopterin reductase-like flavin-dependent oxidoreductase (luciferase family)
MTTSEDRTARAVSVGMFISNHQLPQDDPVRFLGQQLDLVARLSDGGWDSVFVGQHFLLDDVRKAQPFPYLARIAAESGEMRLGVAVLLAALTNPVEVAENVATLDVITGGRFVLGAALGYREVAFDAFRADRGQRVHRLETNLRVIRELLAGRPVDLDEPWCRLDAATLVNLPVQEQVPLWLGASGDRGVERAARIADTWIVNPQASIDTVARQMEVFRAGRSALGLPADPHELPALKEVFCAETREEAFAIVGPHLEAKYRQYLEQGQLDQLPEGEELGDSLERLAHRRFIIGSPEDCIAEMRAWRDIVGVDHFILRTEWETMPHEVARRSAELLTTEVLPELRRG